MAWKYISQTAPNDDGDYTMTWKTTGDKILVTKHNIWDHLYDRNVQDDVHEAGDTVEKKKTLDLLEFKEHINKTID